MYGMDCKGERIWVKMEPNQLLHDSEFQSLIFDDSSNNSNSSNLTQDSIGKSNF